MREILFRAKRSDDKKWIEGGIVVLDPGSDYVFISEPFRSASTLPVRELIYGRTHLVDKETVCQYVGLTDKNGKEMFEADIVKTKFFGKCSGHVNFADYDIFKITYHSGAFYFENSKRKFLIDERAKAEVIGNIFDTPELLKEGDAP